MGNSLLGSSSGSCFVQLHQIVYSPGDVIEGVIHLMISVPCNITSVELKISGKELTYWCERKQETIAEGAGEVRRTRSSDKYYHHHGRRSICKVRVPVYTANGAYLPPGQYSFPFKVQLPANIPGTFHLNDFPGTRRTHGERFNCTCEYKMKGIAVVQGMLKSNIKHQQMLQIVERPPPIVGVAIEDNVQVNICCCLNRGDFFISMRAEKNAFCGSTGEAVRMVVEMENRTEYDVDTIHMELIQRVRMKAQHVQESFESGEYNHKNMRHGWNQYGNHNKTLFKETIAKQETFPGIGQGEVQRGDRARLIEMQLVHALEPQCLGYMIECAYFLRVYAYIQCATNPDVKVPVCIYAPQPPPQAWQAPQPPPGWNPQILSPTSVTVPSVAAPPSQADFYRGFYASAPPMETPIVGQPVAVEMSPGQASQALRSS
ncbi:unnamed protein product [Prorocentrum cordatum]|uniref:Arrestin C-terminal-like domain-containing protein n=1 Tax=Prorocentrum cordatum TaxID=2364126 RepID=A0ABN9QFG8_9DINO|nr:unnamed protein product [Polarella glacialis]